jgi:hypothetical protein
MIAKCILVCALARPLTVWAQPTVLSVCDVLSDPSVHDGRVRTVRGDLTDGHGYMAIRPESCRLAGPRFALGMEVKLATDVSREAQEKLAKLLDRYEYWRAFPTGAFQVTVVGKIETRAATSGDGFGHLGSLPARITVTDVLKVKARSRPTKR